MFKPLNIVHENQNTHSRYCITLNSCLTKRACKYLLLTQQNQTLHAPCQKTIKAHRSTQRCLVPAEVDFFRQY